MINILLGAMCYKNSRTANEIANVLLYSGADFVFPTPSDRLSFFEVSAANMNVFMNIYVHCVVFISFFYLEASHIYVHCVLFISFFI